MYTFLTNAARISGALSDTDTPYCRPNDSATIQAGCVWPTLKSSGKSLHGYKLNRELHYDEVPVLTPPQVGCKFQLHGLDQTGLQEVARMMGLDTTEVLP